MCVHVVFSFLIKIFKVSYRSDYVETTIVRYLNHITNTIEISPIFRTPIQLNFLIACVPCICSSFSTFFTFCTPFYCANFRAFVNLESIFDCKLPLTFTIFAHFPRASGCTSQIFSLEGSPHPKKLKMENGKITAAVSMESLDNCSTVSSNEANSQVSYS